MKIKKLYLKNFRSYQNIEINFNQNLNVIIGKNDIGKSTILEALDIVLNGGSISMEINDYCVNSSDNDIIIGVTLEVDSQHEVIIDSTNRTTLGGEYLLNLDGDLEIYKIWNVNVNSDGEKKLSKEKVYLKSNYPKEITSPLSQMTIAKLKQELTRLGVDATGINQTIKAEIRTAIYEHVLDSGTTDFELLDIELTHKEGKDIWQPLQKELPYYSLFQSDRANKDSDGDIQNPLKAATKLAVKELIEEFERLKNDIEETLNEIGENTIEKMKDMGIEISNNLKPLVNSKSYESLFSFTLEGDDGIPLNKRGSGFRRMVLLNYFRAEAENALLERGGQSIVYSIEEPETSQHPDFQIMLIEALKELSERENHQIFITTHTPEIAKMVNEKNLIFIKKETGITQPKIINDFNEKLTEIANSLGVLPTFDASTLSGVKLVVCVEGPSDLHFLKNVNEVIPEYKSIIDLESPEVIIIPLGGGTVEHFINNKYLEKFRLPELHLYDSDKNQVEAKNQFKYRSFVTKINTKLGDEKFAIETNKAEIENYLHPDIIKNHYGFDTFYHLDEDNWLIKWSDEIDLNKYVKQNKRNMNSSGKLAFSKLSLQLTKEYLEELDAFDEIESWFLKMKELKGLY